MDTKQLLEMLKTEMKNWPRPWLVEAYNYCTNHMCGMPQRTVEYAWWWDLRFSIMEELDKRGKQDG